MIRPRDNRFELLVFDWDGTLSDSVGHILAAIRHAIDSLSLEARADEQIQNSIGLGMREAILHLYPRMGEDTIKQVADRYRAHWLASSKTDLFPGAAELIASLHREGYYLAIATGKSRRGLDRALHETGLMSFFHATRCADETCSKPHPQMLQEIMDSLGISPKNTVMIGDTEHDMKMAHNAGVTAIAANYGSQSAQRLLAFGPMAGIDSLLELPSLLR